MSIAVLAATAALFAVRAPNARAGRSHFAWVPATEVVPERGVELETWILEKNGIGDEDDISTVPDETAVWWMAVVGISDQVELAVPVEIKSLQGADSGNPTLLYGFGGELRWRLASPDPLEAGRIAPALRVGVHRLINQRSSVRASAGLGVGVELSERIHVAGDLGATWIVRKREGDDDSTLELTPAAGVSIRVIDQLRVGAELYGEFMVDGDETNWLAAGPNLAWTHGRFWISAALPIGLMDIRTAPRINWAVAF